MRRLIILAAALPALAGCGTSDPPETPAPCLAPSSAYLRALDAAPGQVRLADGTPISDCLVEEQASGALQTVGKSILDAAGELNSQVRADPGSEAATQLGYLVGAVQEGASSTGGIHQDLVRRLDSTARYAGPGDETFPAAFERAYGRGYAAAQENG